MPLSPTEDTNFMVDVVMIRLSVSEICSKRSISHFRIDVFMIYLSMPESCGKWSLVCFYG